MNIDTIVTTQISQALLLSPVVIGLVGIAKSLGMSGKYGPFAAVILGGGLAVILHAHPLVGIIAGLSAAGLYDAGKSVATPTEPTL